MCVACVCVGRSFPWARESKWWEFCVIDSSIIHRKCHHKVIFTIYFYLKKRVCHFIEVLSLCLDKSQQNASYTIKILREEAWLNINVHKLDIVSLVWISGIFHLTLYISRGTYFQGPRMFNPHLKDCGLCWILFLPSDVVPHCFRMKLGGKKGTKSLLNRIHCVYSLCLF